MSEETSYFRTNRSEITDFLPERYSKVLEVGCGEGCFRANLSGSCEYWGIEPHEVSAKIALSRLDRVIRGEFDESYPALPDDYFDLAICNDVIEHMIDHNDFLQKLSKKMKRNSYIVGSIPNVRHIDNLIDLLVRKDWIYKDIGVLDKTHLRFFTEKSLKRTLHENNYIIEKFDGINRIVNKRTAIGIMKSMLIFILGRDTTFLQFGFRVKINIS